MTQRNSSGLLKIMYSVHVWLFPFVWCKTNVTDIMTAMNYSCDAVDLIHPNIIQSSALVPSSRLMEAQNPQRWSLLTSLSYSIKLSHRTSLRLPSCFSGCILVLLPILSNINRIPCFNLLKHTHMKLVLKNDYCCKDLGDDFILLKPIQPGSKIFQLAAPQQHK